MRESTWKVFEVRFIFFLESSFILLDDDISHLFLQFDQRKQYFQHLQNAVVETERKVEEIRAKNVEMKEKLRRSQHRPFKMFRGKAELLDDLSSQEEKILEMERDFEEAQLALSESMKLNSELTEKYEKCLVEDSLTTSALLIQWQEQQNKKQFASRILKPSELGPANHHTARGSGISS